MSSGLIKNLLKCVTNMLKRDEGIAQAVCCMLSYLCESLGTDIPDVEVDFILFLVLFWKEIFFSLNIFLLYCYLFNDFEKYIPIFFELSSLKFDIIHIWFRQK